MIGISNVLSSEDEIREVQLIKENFEARIKQTGKTPGTHSLGREFATSGRKVAEVLLAPVEEDLLAAISYAVEHVSNWTDLAREDIKNRTSKNIRKMMQEM